MAVRRKRAIEVTCPACDREDVTCSQFGGRLALDAHTVPGTRFPCPSSYAIVPLIHWHEESL